MAVWQLERFVQTHHVQYHVWPEVWHEPDALTQVGYRLELAADAPVASEHAAPGGLRSQVVYEGLREVAEAILPRQECDARFDIEPFDAAWHGRLFPEVTLNISILHRGDGTAAAGDAQRTCVAEMKARLRALGAVETSGTEAAIRTR